MHKKKLSKISLITLIVIVATSLAPLAISTYYVSIATMLLINCILVVSFRFVATMGEFSFTHVAFMGVGSYTTALLTIRMGWPFWLTLPMGGVSAAIVSLVLSYPLLRIKGFYFFVASFAAGQALYLVWTKFEFFGGFMGLSPVSAPNVFGIDFSDFTPYYYLVLVVSVVSVSILYRLEKSRIGSAMKAVAANDQLAQSVGINIRLYKTIAFVTGGFFAGIAGVLLAHRMGYVGPDQFVFNYSLYLMVWTIVGGLYNFSGPIVGLLVLTVIDTILRRFSIIQAYTPLIYGSILIVTLLFCPKGLLDIPRRVISLFKNK